MQDSAVKADAGVRVRVRVRVRARHSCKMTLQIVLDRIVFRDIVEGISNLPNGTVIMAVVFANSL